MAEASRQRVALWWSGVHRSYRKCQIESRCVKVKKDLYHVMLSKWKVSILSKVDLGLLNMYERYQTYTVYKYITRFRDGLNPQ